MSELSSPPIAFDRDYSRYVRTFWSASRVAVSAVISEPPYGDAVMYLPSTQPLPQAQPRPYDWQIDGE